MTLEQTVTLRHLGAVEVLSMPMPQVDEPPSATLGHAEDDALLEALSGIALAAGRLAVGPHARIAKGASDASVADPARRAREIILTGLAEIAPGVPVFDALEAAARPDGRSGEFFLIDPVDGVEELAAGADGQGEFTIDIGLVRDGAPAVGVVYAPALERLWSARPGAAWRADARAGVGVGPGLPISVRSTPEQGLTAVASRANRPPDLDAFLRAYRVAEVRMAGSSLKFCSLAEGSGDVYPQLGRSMAWSTAAGDAILRAAGGRTVTLDGAPLCYAAPCAPGDDALANPQFVALGSTRLRASA
jgi:3'(2'),5'-bisphosphate nucleotidase